MSRLQLPDVDLEDGEDRKGRLSTLSPGSRAHLEADNEEQLHQMEALIERRRRGSMAAHHGDKAHIIEDFAKEHNLEFHEAEKIYAAFHARKEGKEDTMTPPSDAALAKHGANLAHFAAKRRWAGAIEAVKEENRLKGIVTTIKSKHLKKWIGLYNHKINYEDEYHAHWPILTVTYVVVQILVMIIWSITEGVSVDATQPTACPDVLVYRIADVGNCVVNCVDGSYVFTLEHVKDVRGEVWRLFTYALCHTGYTHLMGNIIVELVLGVPLDCVHGSLRMTAMGLCAILGGALTCVWGDPYLAVVGSSGYAYGLIGIHMGNVLLNYTEMQEKNWIPCIKDYQSRVIVLVSLLAFLNAEYIGTKLSGEEDDSTTSHTAHFGGLVMGFFTSIVFLRDLVEHPYEKHIKIAAAVCGFIYIFCSIVWLAAVWRPKALMGDNASIWHPDAWCHEDGTLGNRYGDTC